MAPPGGVGRGGAGRGGAAEAPPSNRASDWDRVGLLVAAIARADFLDAFARCCTESLGADQVTAFVVDDAEARTLLAHRPGGADLVARLCARYVARYVVRDDLLRACRDSGAPFSRHVLLRDEIGDAEYRDSLFGRVGLSGKCALVTRSAGSRLYLNLYYRRAGALARDGVIDRIDRLGRVLSEILLKHDALTGGPLRARTGHARVMTAMRERFDTLSARELEVCSRIVCGFSAEAIGLSLDIAPATVATFRKRAYAKLGVTSQNELFAQFASLASA